MNEDSDGKKNLAFNEELRRQLSQQVYEIGRENYRKQKELLEIPVSWPGKIILALPGALGFLLHAPLYLPLRHFAWKRCRYNDHYDSVLAALLLFCYPLYLLTIVLIIYLLFPVIGVWLLLLLIPFTAWSYVRVKQQLGT
ncbi:MAG: hypothetical protein QM755_01675 [Luteolibacter sp.]